MGSSFLSIFVTGICMVVCAYSRRKEEKGFCVMWCCVERRGGGQRGQDKQASDGASRPRKEKWGGNNRGVVHFVLMARSLKQPAKGEII